MSSNSTKSSALLQFFNQFPGFFLLIFRRMQYHRGLVILALLGVILSVGLVTNASFFSQAVDRVILEQNLAEFSRVTGRPPFSTNVYVFPSQRNPLTLEDAEKLARQIGKTLSASVGLPLRQLGTEVSSGALLLQPKPGSTLYGQGKDLLGSVSAVYIAQVASHLELEAGKPLAENEAGSSEVLEVWVQTSLAQQMGLQVNDEFIIRPTVNVDPVAIRVAGIWHATDPTEEFWFGDPDKQLKEALLVRRDDYVKFVQPMIAAGARDVSWYVILDEKQVIPANSASYLDGFERGQEAIDEFLPGARLNTPPLDPLRDFVQRSGVLTVILLGYNLPALAILLYFLLLISAIITQWQRRETSVLVSRGMNISGIFNLTLLEQLLLFIIGYPLGIAFGMLIARLMGYTASFLAFTGREPLPVSLQGFSFPLTLIALAVSLFSRLWPIVRANRQSIVTDEHEWARPSQAPFWYRYYLDLLLIIPTWYLYIQMSRRGSLVGLVASPDDMYQDPFLIVIPALFIITAALVTMRLFSVVMRLLDVLANRTPWLTIHLALRQLGRQSHEYISPLLLVIISLSMGIYTLSMAVSLDQWLVDRMYYRAGADITFTPLPAVVGEIPSDGNWIAAPQEFTRVEGVLAATRVGNFPSRLLLPKQGDEILGHFLALDRLDFPAVAWWRADLAPEALGSLMNRLALTPDGILVSRQFLVTSETQIGDQLSIQVDANGYFKTRALFTIVGVYENFPTVYPERGFTVVGNLSQLTALFGFTPSHDLWLKIAPEASETAIRKAIIPTVHLVPSSGQDARVMIAAERAKMERVGIFGTLTVGFLAAATMAILGLLLYSYAALRERVYRFSVLHAVGLLHRQIVTQVVMEYTFLAAFGALGGIFIGMLAARLFVPFFRVTGETWEPLPPLIPLTSDRSMFTLAIVFTIIIVLAEVFTITSALHRKLVRIR